MDVKRLSRKRTLKIRKQQKEIAPKQQQRESEVNFNRNSH